MSKLTTRLLQRAADIAAKKSDIQSDLSKAFRQRYGATYSHADCDYLIDTLDYHGGCITLAECDAQMHACGYPALTRPTGDSDASD